jgi:hypothetical protein
MKTTFRLSTLVIVALTGALPLAGSPPPPQFISFHFPPQNARPSSGLTAGPGWRFYGVTYGDDAAGGTGTIYEFAPKGPCSFSFQGFYRTDTAHRPRMASIRILA